MHRKEVEMNQTINILSAEFLGDYRLRLLFDDGRQQVVDFKSFLIHAQHPDILAYLEPEKFAGFRIEYGELIWGDYDLCFPIMDLYFNQVEHGARTDAAA
jgi:hypothetical protein